MRVRRGSSGAGAGRVLAAALVLGAGGAGGAPGQTVDDAAAVEGAWTATWAQAVRTRGSELVEIQRWGDARLTLEARGDRVVGTWWSAAGGVTWSVAGRLVDGRLVLDATEHDSPDPELARVTGMHWRAELVDAGLRGEMWLDLDGMDRPPVRRPWRATRAPPG